MRSTMCWLSVPGDLDDPRPLVSVRDRLALKGLRAVGVCSGRNQGGTMPFSQSFRRPSPARARGPVLAVGWRVSLARSHTGPAPGPRAAIAGTKALGTPSAGNGGEVP